MITCPRCQTSNPDDARFCMNCGTRLPAQIDSRVRDRTARGKTGLQPGGSGIFFLSLALSLLLSFILMSVFKLPIFILAGFLPLLWWGKGRS